MRITASMVLNCLDEKRITIWALARKMETDCSHLRRVITGHRPGSAAFLKAAWDTLKAMPSRKRARHQDIDRLINAAVHVFFVQRGDFESTLFADPGEDTLYGPSRPRTKAGFTESAGQRRVKRLLAKMEAQLKATDAESSQIKVNQA